MTMGQGAPGHDVVADEQVVPGGVGHQEQAEVCDHVALRQWHACMTYITRYITVHKPQFHCAKSPALLQCTTAPHWLHPQQAEPAKVMGGTVDSCRMASCAALLGWSSAKGKLAASCQVASADVATPWHMDIVHAARTPLQSMQPDLHGPWVVCAHALTHATLPELEGLSLRLQEPCTCRGLACPTGPRTCRPGGRCRRRSQWTGGETSA